MSKTAFYIFCLAYVLAIFIMIRIWSFCHDRIYRTVIRKDNGDSFEELTQFGKIMKEAFILIAVLPWFILGFIFIGG